MALRAFRVIKRAVRDGWEYAPPPGSHKSVKYNGSVIDLDWLWRTLGNDTRIDNDTQRPMAMRKAGCRDARACYAGSYAGDIILVDDSDPKLHPTDDEGYEHDRIGTMVELKRSWAPDATIDVSKIAGTRRMQRIMLGPPRPGETLPIG